MSKKHVIMKMFDNKTETIAILRNSIIQDYKKVMLAGMIFEFSVPY